MSSEKLRLRGKAKRRHEEYPLGDIPDRIIVDLAKQFIHRIAVGQEDISGDNFGAIFAKSIKGKDLAKPLGIVDVAKQKSAWSTKTVKHPNPFNSKQVRLISGRNSPDYSLRIANPRANATTTGHAVVKIWNERVNEALEKYDDLRTLVLVRNFSKREFVLFEEEATRFVPSDYKWEFNKKRNLEGHNITTGEHHFTWQPHGSQFTIKRKIPAHARKFSISRNVPQIPMEKVLKAIKFDKSWISIENK